MRMKQKAIKTIGILFSAILLLAGCSSDDENESIVGTWRASYVSSGGYVLSIIYVFQNNGEYNSNTSYKGNGLPIMQLNTKGVYTFSGSSLYLNEKSYDFYDEEAGSSIGSYSGNSEMNTWTFPAKIVGNTLVFSEYKHSALYIGNITFKKD